MYARRNRPSLKLWNGSTPDSRSIQMKVFISSIINGMQLERSAAREAIEGLDHEPVMAEDFGAQPHSSQVACLKGIRDSDAVVLILGEQYGAKQPSGLSATHEEYREARKGHPVFAFLSKSRSHDPDQDSFVREVEGSEGWDKGLFRGTYEDPAELRRQITRAINRWQKSNAAAPLDPKELLARATESLPSDRHGRRAQGSSLVVSIATGPTQEVLRPSELESRSLSQELLKEAMFGAHAIFNVAKGSQHALEDDALVLSQERGGFLSLDGQGTVVIAIPVSTGAHHMGIIEEDVSGKLKAALALTAWILEKVDATQRLTHFAIAARISGADYLGWRTLAEDRASPNSGTMRGMGDETTIVSLKPPHRPRGELSYNAEAIVADLITLLRRQHRV